MAKAVLTVPYMPGKANTGSGLIHRKNLFCRRIEFAKIVIFQAR